MKDMENKRKIIGYKQPFDMYNGEIKAGDLWVKSYVFDFLYVNEKKEYGLPKEIVEQWEPVYEEVKLDDLPKTTIRAFVEDWDSSPFTSIFHLFEEKYPNGVIILPDNE